MIEWVEDTLIDLDTLLILSIEQAEGSVHDFTLYKDSTDAAVSPDVKIKADSGYQGLAAYHTNSDVPFSGVYLVSLAALM